MHFGIITGVLVGYPFGGTAYKLWSPAAPFQLIAIALLFNLGNIFDILYLTFYIFVYDIN